jgi:prepilin-type N-terminal cleavage/methylation domain-containing protein
MNLQRETVRAQPPRPVLRVACAPRLTLPVSPTRHRAPRFTFHVSRFTSSLAFTLIELILVMAILTMVAAVSAPLLSGFFRGRTLDYEARRLLALTHMGQSRAAAEGMPMDLWINAEGKTYGLEAEPSFQATDPKREQIQMDSGLEIQAVNKAVSAPVTTGSRTQTHGTLSVPRAALVHPTLPTIRFLPDGSISDTSPSELVLVARDGSSLRVTQSSDRLTYEIAKVER